MLVDTHAHLYLDAFADDVESVVARARDAGVETIIMPAIDVPSIEHALELSAKYEGLYVMAALHPSEVKNATDADFARVVEFCDDARVVAVGETGLDFYWDRSFDGKQEEFLRRHIRLAVEHDLPVVFHNREATPDLIRIVTEERKTCKDAERLRGIFHCFTGDAEEATAIWNLGFYVGIGGIITFKNSDLDEVVREIPLERVVVETDAPYLAPSPHRGKRNEPAHVRLVAEKIASVKNTTLDLIAEATTKNACSLFGI